MEVLQLLCQCVFLILTIGLVDISLDLVCSQIIYLLGYGSQDVVERLFLVLPLLAVLGVDFIRPDDQTRYGAA